MMSIRSVHSARAVRTDLSAMAVISHCRGRDPVGAQDLADGASTDPVPEAA
ncbi:MAG TPA: hypothetical protein VF482_05120 [Trebonia sp.]